MSNKDLANMAGTTDTTEDTERRSRAKRALEQLHAAQMSIVPHNPTQYMIAIGAHAGGVDIITARRIYRAMLAASQNHPTIH
jgi:hypothetical protein